MHSCNCPECVNTWQFLTAQYQMLRELKLFRISLWTIPVFRSINVRQQTVCGHTLILLPLLEKLTLPQLVNKLSSFYEIQRFMTFFTTVPSWAKWNQSTYHSISLLPILYYSVICTLVFQVVSFQQVSPSKFCMNFFPSSHVPHTPLTSSPQYHWTSTNLTVPLSLQFVTSSHLGPNIFPSVIFMNITICSAFSMTDKLSHQYKQHTKLQFCIFQSLYTLTANGDTKYSGQKCVGHYWTLVYSIFFSLSVISVGLVCQD